MRGDLLGNMLGGTGRRLRPLGERPSAIALTLALTLPIVIGIVGLGIEASDWVLEKRKLQEAVATGSAIGPVAQPDNIHGTAAEVALADY